MNEDKKVYTPPPQALVAADDEEKLTVEEAWTILCETPDITSPEEYPDHALITMEQLGSFMARSQPDLLDKIDGLSSDLDSAVEVAFKRGATEWVRLNYPSMFEALSKRWPKASEPLSVGTFDGAIDTDTPLQAAAREAGWALTTLVDISDWQRRDQLSDIIGRLAKALIDVDTGEAETPRSQMVAGKFSLGDRVRKTKGSSWQGRIVGFYSTELTPIGYAVESEREPGSVQIYPEPALAKLED